MDGVISVTQSVVTFASDQAAATLPQGQYHGVLAEAEHILGANGSKVIWLFVEIVEAPDGAQDWVGRKINVRLSPVSRN